MSIHTLEGFNILEWETSRSISPEINGVQSCCQLQKKVRMYNRFQKKDCKKTCKETAKKKQKWKNCNACAWDTPLLQAKPLGPTRGMGLPKKWSECWEIVPKMQMPMTRCQHNLSPKASIP